MDSLGGQVLVRRSGEEVLADVVLADVDVICYYFSAHWCPPCRMFTPTLADFYAELKEKQERVEIVFVSSDRSVQDMMAYMREDHGDWLAVPFGERLAQELMAKYNVQGIPMLVVVTKEGELITNEGLTEVHSSGTLGYKRWTQRKIKGGISREVGYGGGRSAVGVCPLPAGIPVESGPGSCPGVGSDVSHGVSSSSVMHPSH